MHNVSDKIRHQFGPQRLQSSLLSYFALLIPFINLSTDHALNLQQFVVNTCLTFLSYTETCRECVMYSIIHVL